eukprot:scaffold2177_cov272-Pinguiococcus_pyrenoidosus.AAC.8
MHTPPASSSSPEARTPPSITSTSQLRPLKTTRCGGVVSCESFATSNFRRLSPRSLAAPRSSTTAAVSAPQHPHRRPHMGAAGVCAYLCVALALFSAQVHAFRAPLRAAFRKSGRLGATKEDEDTRNVAEWATVLKEHRGRRFQVIAAEAWEDMALKLEREHPERFRFHTSSWGHWPDGTDNIEIGGFSPHNVISGSHVVFLANFESNAQTLSQFSVIITLLQSFVESLTVVLPFYPVGQMERITKPGQVEMARQRQQRDADSR